MSEPLTVSTLEEKKKKKRQALLLYLCTSHMEDTWQKTSVALLQNVTTFAHSVLCLDRQKPECLLQQQQTQADSQVCV